MRFFDANLVYGIPCKRQDWRYAGDARALCAALDRAGVAGGLVRREEQFYAGACTGNALVAADTRQSERLWGVWCLLPPQTGEVPAPGEILARMREERIAAWQFLPGQHQFCFHRRVVGQWLELAQAHRVPIFADLQKGPDPGQWLDALDDFPGLRLLLAVDSVWPRDRLLRPLLDAGPGVMLETSWYQADHGLEQLVTRYGAERLLYGSRFQQSYFGGAMLLVRHARISARERELIAGGNLLRLLSEVRYDQP